MGAFFIVFRIILKKQRGKNSSSVANFGWLPRLGLLPNGI